MAIWSLAKKEFRLLLRDWRAALILVAMPLLFILVLGLLLGEGFGQKPDDRIRVLMVDRDQQPDFFCHRGQIAAVLASAPGGPLQVVPALGVPPGEPWPGLVPGRTWTEEVRDDLKESGIRVDLVAGEEEGQRLVRDHRQPAVLVFEPGFSNAVCYCSFLTDGINPFNHDGVDLDKVNVRLLDDPRQPAQAAIIKQVTQVTLVRVILPYMIGKAFRRLSEPEFIELLGNRVTLPVPPTFRLVVGKDRLSLSESLEMAAEHKPAVVQQYKQRVGAGVQAALRKQFENYDLTGMTWSRLTKSRDRRTDAVLASGTIGLAGSSPGPGPLLAAGALPPGRPEPQWGEGEVAAYVNRDGSGPLHFGAQRYQLLVPSYTVMFAFFLVMTVGWLFAAERRQGTLKRLRAAPITRSEVLVGKFVPVFLLALGQGVLLLLAGRLVFGMRWGPAQWSLLHQLAWLLPVVTATALAATGLALLVAALARTEVQVALYGAVPVLVLALIGGCVLPREMMPEQTQWLTLLAPQGWALDAYRELLDPNPNYVPNLDVVARGCAGLAAFGAVFLGVAWWRLPLD
jgi:ABC-type multidrug transport system permease subunit